MHADDLRNQKLYSTLLAKYGDDARSLNWGSRQSQQYRFTVLSEIGIRSGNSVLDVGCGLGDFLGWCRSKQLDVNYTGVDITPEMLAFCQTRYPEANFELGSVADLGEVTAVFDYVIASGIFTHRIQDPVSYFHQGITLMWRLAGQALGFNALSQWAGMQEPDEFYADPLATIDFCRSLTPWVTLRHDYAAHDFTIYMFKNPPSHDTSNA